MSIHEFSGARLILNENDLERGYFEAASQHKLVMQKCKSCGVLRWPPGTGCPWCNSPELEWEEVSGKGTIFSYAIVVQSIIPGFREQVPYPTIVVELDEQRSMPESSEKSLRIQAMLVDEYFKAEKENNVAVGKRVEVVFMDVDPGFSIPMFRLSSSQPQETFWQYEQK